VRTTFRVVAFTLVAPVCLLCIPASARAGDDDLLTVKGQPQQKYYLIGAEADAGDEKDRVKARGLLVVLPGGDGSEQFHPFVTNIQKNALPDGYLLAQLIAVQAKPNPIVWPTEKLRHRKQAFTTEQFIENVVREVKAKHKVDDARVFVLAWSSSGSPAYAITLKPNSPVRGAAVAMSVFKPGDLPPLAGAKGKRFAILHSEEDKVTPIRMARDAEKRLAEAGAEVKFIEMAGGHGWQDDPFGRIREAVEFLEKNAGRPR
jgi:predicted esterase